MMINAVFSREFLQGVPEHRKHQLIDSIVQSFRIELYNAAAEGKKSYIYVRPQQTSDVNSWLPTPEVTDAELIAGFFTHFPGCAIYRDETTRGFVIDWS